jgi:hypothetical protein
MSRYLLWYRHHETCPCFRCSKVLPPLPLSLCRPAATEPPPSSEPRKARKEEELLREDRAVATALSARKPGCSWEDFVARRGAKQSLVKNLEFWDALIVFSLMATAIGTTDWLLI